MFFSPRALGSGCDNRSFSLSRTLGGGYLLPGTMQSYWHSHGFSPVVLISGVIMTVCARIHHPPQSVSTTPDGEMASRRQREVEKRAREYTELALDGPLHPGGL